MPSRPWHKIQVNNEDNTEKGKGKRRQSLWKQACTGEEGTARGNVLYPPFVESGLRGRTERAMKTRLYIRENIYTVHTQCLSFKIEAVPQLPLPLMLIGLVSDWKLFSNVIRDS